MIAPSLVRRWLDLVGPEHLFMAYGMTEGLGLTALRGDEWLDRPGSVGRGYRDTEIRIVDPDSGAELPAGEVGEIYLRSPTSGMYRYLGGAPLLPARDDGFASAGDIGHLDDAGFLYVLDRRVDMVVTGGANVYPAEVESALVSHPKVAEAAVVGRPDELKGQAIVAFVTLKSGYEGDDAVAAELREHVSEKIGKIARPHGIIFTADLPKTRSGKIMRRLLRDVAQGRPLGDVTTLANAEIVDQIHTMVEAGSSANDE